jgi:hypothetical protein
VTFPHAGPPEGAPPAIQRPPVRLVLVRVSLFPQVELSTSDISEIRAAEKALAEAFESPERTTWVDFYTDDAVFVAPGVPAIEARRALLDIAPQISISSMEIVVHPTLSHGLAPRARPALARRA